MSTPHKHADLIKAWADGALIQFRPEHTTEWEDCTTQPYWYNNFEYRVKPEPPPRVFPKSSLTYGDLCVVANQASVQSRHTNEGFATIVARIAADAAVKQYILDTEKNYKRPEGHF